MMGQAAAEGEGVPASGCLLQRAARDPGKLAVPLISDILLPRWLSGAKGLLSEENLVPSRERLEDVLGILRDAILVVAATDRVEYANIEFMRMFGLDRPPEQMIGLNAHDTIKLIARSYADPGKEVERIRQIVERGEPVHEEEVRLVQDRTVLRTYRPVIAEGRPVRHVWQHVDISYLKHIQTELAESRNRLAAMNQELRVARTRAELANRSKSEFLAHMSHELRTPLNAIIGFSDMMTQKVFGALSPKYEEYSKDINDSGRHLLQLLTDILDMSKIEAGRYEIAPGPVDLRACAEFCMRQLDHRAMRNGIRLENAIPAGLPPAHADERALRQILLNLMTNAVKFTQSGGKVTVGASVTADGAALITVADTGIGMDEAEIPLALEPFRQIGSAPEGTGLGLSITHRLVDLHGGRLDIASRPGQGTTVTVRLPGRHS